tara:strand:+ start:39963 stop:40946 length:984 start_codon:yes stop_codon:yes gene_type:complete
MAVIAVAAVSVVGMAIYSLTRTMEVPGQKLGDIAQQTAKEGEPRQIVFGLVRPIGGNIVAVQEPPRVERRKQKSGGKGGGGGSSQTVEIPRRTYAVGICEGPVTGIRRAWRNNKLVYDGRGTEWGAKNNGTFLQRFTFYLGGWDQMPDPSLEAVFGAGEVPAMRGTCYMVARDEDLQDTGGAVPQWIFEVERAYGYGLTSRPYPLEAFETAESGASIAQARKNKQPEDIDECQGSAIVSLVNKTRVARYSQIDSGPDSTESSATVPEIVKTRVARYSTYYGMPENSRSGASVTYIEKTRAAGYLTYRIPAEPAESTATVAAITKSRV